jgi:hypothetical protein
VVETTFTSSKRSPKMADVRNVSLKSPDSFNFVIFANILSFGYTKSIYLSVSQKILWQTEQIPCLELEYILLQLACAI